MKKQMARIILICFVLFNLLPLTVLAAGNSAPPEKPYEKVVAKDGRWYAEQLAYDGKTNLVVGYTGSWKNIGTSVMEMEVKEKILLTGIYIPVAGISEADMALSPGEGSGTGNVVLSISDSQGNVYTGFTAERQISGLRESGEPGSDVLGSFEKNSTYLFSPNGDIVLPRGRYILMLEGTGIPTGAYLVKGIHHGACEKYREDLIAWELENNPDAGGEATRDLGEKALAEDNGAEYEYGMNDALDPPVFALDGEYQIDEIIVSTYNNGQGAMPGIMAIIGENGQTYYTGQSYGVSIENIANAAWKIAPGIVLPAGNYMIALSQPEALSYDGNGEPLFYVKASIPVQLRVDFTGTYRIDLDAYKTSTLAGSVSDQGSSFSLRDFELTVLDKDGELELIGQYEGMPFSQRCEVVEETEDKIVARFAFAADLTKLPYKAKISADAVVTLAMAEDGTVQIDIGGTGVFDRAASASKGADHNTYDIKANGVMTQRELPPFVMTALGKAGGAGSVPGPDNAAQAAAGILFPPLVGLVVNVLQEALKPKAPAKKAVRDLNWYKKKYPGKTDEQLAMIMLADAMGNTDNPDEGDAVSVGDNESGGNEYCPGGGASGGSAFEGSDEWESEAGYQSEDEPEWKPEEGNESVPESAAAETEAQPVSGDEQLPQEPETMVLKTSANGAESIYVKDPVTGEWVNPETGGALDLEKYPEAMEQMQQNKEWSAAREEEIQSKGGSEHDKALKKSMEEIREKEQKAEHENYLRKKYGTDDLEKIAEIVKERKESAEEWAKIWHRNDKILGTMEVGAVVAGTAADVGIDGLSVIVPGGSGIKAGYKVLKGVAGTMAEAGAKGKDALTWANLAEGGIKGVADAALDKMPGGDGLVGDVLSNLGKAALTSAGEGAGAGVGAALRGEDAIDALEKGLKSGAYKAAVGAVTDKVAGGLPTPVMSRGSFKAVPNLKNVIVSRVGVTKIASTLTDEYAVKPVVLGN